MSDRSVILETKPVVEKIDNTTINWMKDDNRPVYTHFHAWWVSLPGCRGRVAIWALAREGVIIADGDVPHEYAISNTFNTVSRGAFRNKFFLDAVITAMAVLQHHNGSGDMPT